MGRILVMDNDRAVAGALSGLLTRYGCRSVPVADWLNGLRVFMFKPPSGREEFLRAAAPASPSGSKPAEKKRPLILVADDDSAMRGVLKKFFSGAGYDVITAADGIAAERLARETRPDIVLLDIYMPRRSGVEVLGTLFRELPGTGIVMLSGNDSEEVARGCLTLGAFDYFSKPVNLEALGASVKGRLFLQGS
ncbi:MAG: response regulator [Elusimicrobiales bacterium]|nr:response regulator [Elusimicrobiales bacterium]